jgi:hypothetical protein
MVVTLLLLLAAVPFALAENCEQGPNVRARARPNTSDRVARPATLSAQPACTTASSRTR